jgi:hypothetical protein
VAIHARESGGGRGGGAEFPEGGGAEFPEGGGADFPGSEGRAESAERRGPVVEEGWRAEFPEGGGVEFPEGGGAEGRGPAGMTRAQVAEPGRRTAGRRGVA